MDISKLKCERHKIEARQEALEHFEQDECFEYAANEKRLDEIAELLNAYTPKTEVIPEIDAEVKNMPLYGDDKILFGPHALGLIITHYRKHGNSERSVEECAVAVCRNPNSISWLFGIFSHLDSGKVDGGLIVHDRVRLAWEEERLGYETD